jgi:hypothetical protein
MIIDSISVKFSGTWGKILLTSYGIHFYLTQLQPDCPAFRSSFFFSLMNMKITAPAVLACFPLSAILIWSAAAQSDPVPSESEPFLAQTEAEARMEDRKEDIAERVGMSAPLELPEGGERDVVAEAMADGHIIEATLEEVEAALNAAKLTPETEDDVAAMNLAHWGRFFLDGQPSSESLKAIR